VGVLVIKMIYRLTGQVFECEKLIFINIF